MISFDKDGIDSFHLQTKGVKVEHVLIRSLVIIVDSNADSFHYIPRK
jgi:hypothetical protein